MAAHYHAVASERRCASQQKLCADVADGSLATALREEYRTDKEGRHYRAKHAVRATRDGKQLSFWVDIDTAPRAHMEKAFAQRRRQIVSDSHQLRLDVDHFNSVHSEEPQLELVLDFSDDVKEMMIAEGLEDVA